MKAEAEDRGSSARFIHGDMRELAAGTTFDAILCWGTTFGYFEEEANRVVLAKRPTAFGAKAIERVD